MQKLVDDMGERFIRLVQKHRKPNQYALAEISTARVFLADEALKLGLVDKVCYLSDAIRDSKQLAGTPRRRQSCCISTDGVPR